MPGSYSVNTRIFYRTGGTLFSPNYELTVAVAEVATLSLA
jgi:hypothetical protein